MTRSPVTCAALFAISLIWSAAAEAQIDNRGATSLRDRMQNRMNSGASSRANSRANPGANGGANLGANPGAVAEDVGGISGDERFLRDARDAADFVGAGSREGGFVGGQSAVGDGEITSAIEGDLVREAVQPAINRLLNLPQLPTGMYAPRLRLGFTPTILPAPAIEMMAVQRLSVSSAIRSTRPFEVSMAGRTATLRGAVASEHEKRLAGLMLLFEPGISKVENELAVASSASKIPAAEPLSLPAPAALPAPAPQKERPSDRS